MRKVRITKEQLMELSLNGKLCLCGYNLFTINTFTHMRKVVLFTNADGSEYELAELIIE